MEYYILGCPRLRLNQNLFCPVGFSNTTLIKYIYLYLNHLIYFLLRLATYHRFVKLRPPPQSMSLFQYPIPIIQTYDSSHQYNFCCSRLINFHKQKFIKFRSLKFITKHFAEDASYY